MPYEGISWISLPLEWPRSWRCLAGDQSRTRPPWAPRRTCAGRAWPQHSWTTSAACSCSGQERAQRWNLENGAEKKLARFFHSHLIRTIGRASQWCIPRHVLVPVGVGFRVEDEAVPVTGRRYRAPISTLHVAHVRANFERKIDPPIKLAQLTFRPYNPHPGMSTCTRTLWPCQL